MGFKIVMTWFNIFAIIISIFGIMMVNGLGGGGLHLLILNPFLIFIFASFSSIIILNKKILHLSLIILATILNILAALLLFYLTYTSDSSSSVMFLVYFGLYGINLLHSVHSINLLNKKFD